MLAASDPLGMRIGRGTEVGGFVIDGELGHGGMGVVYSATHPVIGKRAAIKILRLDMSRSQTAIERFIQEARAVNRIGHPNIINIFAYGALADGRAYQIMDLLSGESLRQRVARGPLPIGAAVSVADEVASALTAVHEHGFIHRDLKPENVFLGDRDDRWVEVKLLDFGLAKLMPEYGSSAVVTRTGALVGTPEYMSPEQARGLPIDHRTDIYALGLVMYEMLSGHGPFPPATGSVETAMQHVKEPPMPLDEAVAGLPDELVRLVAALLAKPADKRPSLAAVRAVLKRVRGQLPTFSIAGETGSALRPVAPATASPSAETQIAGEDMRIDAVHRRIGATPVTTPGLGIEALRAESRPRKRAGSDRPGSDRRGSDRRAARAGGADSLQPTVGGAPDSALTRSAGLRGAGELEPLPPTMFDVGGGSRSTPIVRPMAPPTARWPWFLLFVLLASAGITLAIAMG